MPEAYDHSRVTFWAITGGAFLLLIVASVASGDAANSNGAEAKGHWGRLFFPLSTAIFVLSGRWPYLFFRHYFNPDESQQIAGGITLTHFPWFWLNVDGHTAGPMDLYYLCVPAAWHGAINYMTVRSSGIAMILGTLFFCYRTFRLQFSQRTARIALLPLATFFAWVTDDDFVEISTEHMPVFLLTGGMYFFLRASFSRTKASRSWFFAGLLLGLAPWAKLQASVFVVGAILISIAQCFYSGDPPRTVTAVLRHLQPFAIGVGLPCLPFGLLMVSTGQVFSFYQSYLAANLDYVYRGTAKYYLLSELWLFSCESGFFPLLFVGAALWALTHWFWRKRVGNRPSHLKWFYGYVVLAFLTVISPGRPFLHYLLFMVPALGLWAGWAWAECAEMPPCTIEKTSGTSDKHLGALIYAGPWLLGFLFLRSLFPPPFQGTLQHEWHRPLSRPAAVVLPYLKTGDSIALWGWRPDIYVELQAPQAVRDGHTQREMEDTPFRPYYRERYLADLRKNQPVAFIDAVGPNAFVFLDRKRFGFETFPALTAYIAAGYREVDDSPLGRVFIRNDRLQAR